jgi:hypothetical protein
MSACSAESVVQNDGLFGMLIDLNERHRSLRRDLHTEGQVLASVAAKYSLVVFLLLAVLPAGKAAAQSREDCLACHSDPSLTTERAGREVSLYTDDRVLKKSPHAKLVCVACHIGFSAEEMPHKETITPVNCLSCHRSAPMQHRFHPQMAKARGDDSSPDVSCKDCHGTHEVVAKDRPGFPYKGKQQVESCGACHGDISEPFAASDHGQALAADVKGAPDCLSCHRKQLPRLTVQSDSDAVKRIQ